MELEKLRSEVDRVNKKIIETLRERFSITRKIGELKAKNGMNSIDKNREKIVLDNIKKLARENDLNEIMAEKIFKIIMDQVVIEHNKIKC